MGTVPWTDPSEINNRPQEALAETIPTDQHQMSEATLAQAVLTQLGEDLQGTNETYRERAILDVTNPQNWLEYPPALSPSLTLRNLAAWCEIAGLEWWVLRADIIKRYPNIEQEGAEIRARKAAKAKTVPVVIPGQCAECRNEIGEQSRTKPRKYCLKCSPKVQRRKIKEWQQG